MKVFSTILLLISLITAFLFRASAAASVSLSIRLNKTTAEVGELIEVTVQFTEPLYMYTLGLTYFDDYLEIVSVSGAGYKVKGNNYMELTMAYFPSDPPRTSFAVTFRITKLPTTSHQLLSFQASGFSPGSTGWSRNPYIIYTVNGNDKYAENSSYVSMTVTDPNATVSTPNPVPTPNPDPSPSVPKPTTPRGENSSGKPTPTVPVSPDGSSGVNGKQGGSGGDLGKIPIPNGENSNTEKEIPMGEVDDSSLNLTDAPDTQTDPASIDSLIVPGKDSVNINSQKEQRSATRFWLIGIILVAFILIALILLWRTKKVPLSRYFTK